jgi:hypothetical protein
VGHGSAFSAGPEGDTLELRLHLLRELIDEQRVASGFDRDEPHTEVDRHGRGEDEAARFDARHLRDVRGAERLGEHRTSRRRKPGWAKSPIVSEWPSK